MSETTSLDSQAARLDAVIRPFLDRAAPVGMAIGVVRDGRLVYARHSGKADLATSRRVDATTPFRIGSISKAFTAIAVMQLRDRGLLDLDDAVARHLRSVRWVTRPGHRPATIRHVLTHTSGVGELRGWRDALRVSTYCGLGVKRGAPVPSLSHYYRRGLTPEVAPGTKWAYANHAFTALGQLIEDVSGEPFADYMRVNVFDVLGMARTDFLRTRRIGEPATGYRLVRGRPRRVAWQDMVTAPAGSAVSSLADMARFVGWLMSSDGDGAVLAPSTLGEMFQQHWTADPRLPGQGLGFLRDEIGGHGVIWHDGAWPGFISSMLVAPEARLGVLAFNNSSSSVSHEVADAVLRDLLGVSQERSATPVPASVAERVIGSYRPLPGLQTNLRHWAMLGGGLTICRRDGQLVATGRFGLLRKPVVLRAADERDCLLLEGVVPVKSTSSVPLRLAFQHDGRGQVTEVAGSLLVPFRFRRHA